MNYLLIIACLIIGMIAIYIILRKSNKNNETFINVSVSCIVDGDYKTCEGQTEPEKQLDPSRCTSCSKDCVKQGEGFASPDGKNYIGQIYYYCGINHVD